MKKVFFSLIFLISFNQGFCQNKFKFEDTLFLKVKILFVDSLGINTAEFSKLDSYHKLVLCQIINNVKINCRDNFVLSVYHPFEFKINKIYKIQLVVKPIQKVKPPAEFSQGKKAPCIDMFLKENSESLFVLTKVID